MFPSPFFLKPHRFHLDYLVLLQHLKKGQHANRCSRRHFRKYFLFRFCFCGRTSRSRIIRYLFKHLLILHQVQPYAGVPRLHSHMNISSARITVAGTVASVDEYVNAFTITFPSRVPHRDGLQPLKIRAILKVKTATIAPPRRLPVLNSIVSLTGQMIAADAGIIVVLADDITYFPRLRTVVRIRRCPHARHVNRGEL